MADIARTNVAAVVHDEEGRVLLCKRAMYKKVAPGVRHMPGGAIDAGESVAEAIARELREELGLAVGEVKETGVFYDYRSAMKCIAPCSCPLPSPARRS